MLARLLERPGLRLAVVVAASLLSIVWLFGPELMLTSIQVEGELSQSEKMLVRLFKVVSFVIANAALMQFLFNRLQARPSGPSYLSHALGSMADGIAYTDASGVLVYANTSFLRLFDLGQDVLGQVGIQDIVRSRVDGAAPSHMLSTTSRVDLALRTARSSGRSLDLRLGVEPYSAAVGGHLVTVTDISDLRQLRDRAALSGNALDAVQLSMVVCDATRLGWPIVYANRATEQLTQYGPAELLGAPWNLLQGVERDQAGLAAAREAIERRVPITVELRSFRKNGCAFLAEVSVSPVLDKADRLTHIVCVQRDITRERAVRDSEQQRLFHDEISSLLNRPGFMRAFSEQLQTATTSHLLLKTNIRNFHEFNTAAGWEMGDALLAEVGRRLAQALPGAIVGRVAADHYAVALPVSLAEVTGCVATIRRALEGRYTIPGLTCDPLLGIGYTIVPPGSHARAAMQQSSVALKEACRGGNADIRRFDRAMENRISERRRLAAELQQAVERRNFEIEFLPEVELATGHIIAVEALVRWLHPLFGTQQPAGFLALAEETGLIQEIGAMVLAKATEFATRRNGPNVAVVPVAVNLSPTELRRPDIVAVIERALSAAGALPDWLELEVSESTIASASPETLTSLSRLRSLGVRLVIDDFGAGQSPLNYLARCPVDKIKVDRSFTAGIQHAGVKRAVLKAILDIGNAQDAVVVAEGVETEAERQMLLRLGCKAGQGFLFSRPVRSDALEVLLNAGGTLPLAAE